MTQIKEEEELVIVDIRTLPDDQSEKYPGSNVQSSSPNDSRDENDNTKRSSRYLATDGTITRDFKNFIKEEPELIITDVQKPNETVVSHRSEKSDKVHRAIKRSRHTNIFSEHQCQICLKYFSNSYNLKLHHKNIHNRDEFQCKFCHKIFLNETKSKSENHLCGTRKFCKFCEKFISSSDFNKHTKRFHSDKLNVDWIFCDICGDKFASKMAIRQHFLKLTCKVKRTFECDFCGKVFSEKSGLISHLNCHISFKVKCKICKSKMKPHGLAMHMNLYHKFEEVQCDICGNFFQNLSRIRKHMRFHDKKFNCNICGLKFAILCNLRAHMKFHEGSEKLTCKICGHRSRDTGDLGKHIKTHDRTREKRLKCPRCSDYQTDKKDHLRNHLKFHDKQDENFRNWPKAVRCEKCPRVCMDNICYKRHVKNIHENPKLFKCEICEENFRNKRDLKNHKQVEHGLEKKKLKF